MCSEHKTKKVMICTYWWWLSVTGKREVEQYKRSEPVRSVQCAVSRKTQKYINMRHCVKPVWSSLWWSSRTLDQCQITRWAFSTEFQWCYVSSNAENLRLWWDISTYYYYVNWDVKMHHLWNRLKHISGCITKRNLWALTVFPWPWTVIGNRQWWWVVRYWTTALLCDEASCYTAAGAILCSL